MRLKVEVRENQRRHRLSTQAKGLEALKLLALEGRRQHCILLGLLTGQDHLLIREGLRCDNLTPPPLIPEASTALLSMIAPVLQTGGAMSGGVAFQVDTGDMQRRGRRGRGILLLRRGRGGRRRRRKAMGT